MQPDTLQEIVLDPSGSLTVEVLGPNGPAAGVSVQLIDARLRWEVADRQHVGGSGRASWYKLHPGPYEVVVRGEGYFPLERVVEVDGVSRKTLRVAERCDLLLQLLDQDGNPLPLTPVDLSSVDQAGTVLDWADEGWVELPAGGLATDGAGRLSLRRVATGPYEWHAAGASGSFSLTSGPNEVSLTVPR